MADITYGKMVSRLLLSGLKNKTKEELIEAMKNATPEEREKAAKFGIALPQPDDNVIFSL